MPHFLIFDSGWEDQGLGAPTTRLGTDAYPQGLQIANIARYTVPVFLLGVTDPKVESRRISYEFYYTANVTTDFTLHWWQLFYNDVEKTNVLLGALANVRRSKALGAVNVVLAPWAREQTTELAGAGVINHFSIERVITFQPTQLTSKWPIADARWFPLEVHAVCVALSVHAASALPAGGRLRIFATIGGVIMEQAAEEATILYDGIALPDAATGSTVY
jgi:hypothetical protein